MNKVILRVEKLKTMGNIAGSGHHTFRTLPTPNADAARTPLNVAMGPANTADLLAAVRGRLPEKRRKDAVLCLEYLITASPEYFGHDWRERENYGKPYFSDALEWIKAKHGAENVVCANLQLDETSPHLVVYVVPRLPDGSLSAKHFTGGKAKMSKMQTVFAEDVGKKYGLERGIEGSKAKHKTIRQYYERVNEAFQPLPEVQTPLPKDRPEPEKPPIWAGAAAKEAYAEDHAQWEREQAQKKQHFAEVRKRNAAAIEAARRNEAQASETAALRDQVEQLKRANSRLSKVVAKLEPLAATARLLTPAEVKAVHDRKQQQEAEQQRKAAEAKAAEVAARQAAKIAAETARRIADIDKVRQSSAGAAYTWASAAKAAMQKVGDDPSKIDWVALEAKIVHEAIGRHGQDPKNVAEALLRHSPGRSDPAGHEKFRESVLQAGQRLLEQYRQSQNHEAEAPRPGMR